VQKTSAGSAIRHICIKETALDKNLDNRTMLSMTRVTGKFQITLPKRLVDAFGIHVGDEVELVAAGDVIAIVPASAAKLRLSREERLQHFDQATRRQELRSRAVVAETEGRGWSRDELYDRGRPG